MGFGGLGLGGEGEGLKLPGSVFVVQVLGIRVEGLGLRVYGL